MKLTSPEFEEGETLPKKYCSTREDVNPPLEISKVPADAESLALIIEDPDAEEFAGKTWEHWTVWNISPDREKIPEDWDVTNAVEGMTDFRKKAYGGPNPPDGNHEGRIRLFALDQEIGLDDESRRKDLLEAMEGHILEESEMKVEFEPV